MDLGHVLTQCRADSLAVDICGRIQVMAATPDLCEVLHVCEVEARSWAADGWEVAVFGSGGVLAGGAVGGDSFGGGQVGGDQRRDWAEVVS